jgi:hypothetical protein
MVAVVLMSGAAVQAGTASAQVAPGPCELSADELAAFPLITLQHDLSCGTTALPASAAGAFWLNLNGHRISVYAGANFDASAPAVMSGGVLSLDSTVHVIDHTVLWAVTVEGPVTPFVPEPAPTVVYRGPAIVSSVFGFTNLTVAPTGHSIVLRGNVFVGALFSYETGPVTVADDVTTGQPIAPLTVDIESNFTNMGIVVRADTIASGQIANNLLFDGRGLAVQAGAVNQLAVTSNTGWLANGPAISITGAGASGVTDGGGNRDISNQVTGAGVPNCIGIVCTP